jgi:RimJ/RimL family protein N-acetyltransferase
MRLEGQLVRLEPLAYTHTADLFAHCADPDVWAYLPTAMPRTEEEYKREIWSALAHRDAGLREPFAVIDLATDTAIGSTSFLDVAPDEFRLEIGWTYYAKEFWRTHVNTECKYLLLSEAFDKRGCQRVAFRTDVKNERSQEAIERIGGVREGVIRNHRIRPDGSWRSSVQYSILADEWPSVKARLEQWLARPNGAAGADEGKMAQ